MKVTLAEIASLAAGRIVREYRPGEHAPFGTLESWAIVLDAHVAFVGRSRMQARKAALTWLQEKHANKAEEPQVFTEPAKVEEDQVSEGSGERTIEPDQG
jgi:hypothetical protein